MDDQHEQQPRMAEAAYSPLPLDYGKSPAPKPGRWGCFSLTCVWMLLTGLACGHVGLIWEASGRLGLMILALACPFATLAEIGLDDGPVTKIARAALTILPWPAYGLALTWVDWRWDRRRTAITVGVLAAVHTAAFIAAVVLITRT